MTAPERIWIDAWGGNWSPVSGGTQGIEYIRADLAQTAQVREPVAGNWGDLRVTIDAMSNAHGTDFEISDDVRKQALLELQRFEGRGFPAPKLLPEDGLSFVWRCDGFSIYFVIPNSGCPYFDVLKSTIEPQPDPRDDVSDAARDVLAERARQISVELFHPRSDDAYQARDLASAAACYCFAAAGYLMAHDGEPPKWWPWAKSWWKPSKDAPRRDLVKAGALILAEIERIDRAALAAAKAVQHG